MLQHISVANCSPKPWKNGGGITRELLIWPNDAADPEDWQLRISVADITQDGAFSSFEGVIRHFAVIEGMGVKLRFLNHECIVIPGTEPLRFDGADAPYCELLDGATRDLNVMCKHGHPIALTCAYAGQSRQARGFFDKTTQTLTWGNEPCLLSAPPGAAGSAGEWVGWWIETASSGGGSTDPLTHSKHPSKG